MVKGCDHSLTQGQALNVALGKLWGMEVLRYTLLSPSLGAIHAGSLGFNFQLYTNLYWPLVWKLLIGFKVEHMVRYIGELEGQLESIHLHQGPTF